MSDKEWTGVQEDHALELHLACVRVEACQASWNKAAVFLNKGSSDDEWANAEVVRRKLWGFAIRSVDYEGPYGPRADRRMSPRTAGEEWLLKHALKSGAQEGLERIKGPRDCPRYIARLLNRPVKWVEALILELDPKRTVGTFGL